MVTVTDSTNDRVDAALHWKSLSERSRLHAKTCAEKILELSATRAHSVVPLSYVWAKQYTPFGRRLYLTVHRPSDVQSAIARSKKAWRLVPLPRYVRLKSLNGPTFLADHAGRIMCEIL